VGGWCFLQAQKKSGPPKEIPFIDTLSLFLNLEVVVWVEKGLKTAKITKHSICLERVVGCGKAEKQLWWLK